MSGRYSRIVQSARLRQAADRYAQYLQGTLTRPSRVGTRGARPARARAYVVPFGFDLPTSTFVNSSVIQEDFNVLGPIINGTGTGGEVVQTVAGDVETRVGFSAARIVSFINPTRSVQVETSDITGLQYLKYNGTRRSCPFGRKAVDDDVVDVFEAVKVALRTSNPNAAILRVSLQQEKYRY